MCKSLKITKMSGAGNLFVFVNLLDKQTHQFFKENFASQGYPTLSQKLCSKNTPWKGADGAAFLLANSPQHPSQTEKGLPLKELHPRKQPPEGLNNNSHIDDNNKTDFKWEFYNQDGSSAEMCGNAARCVTRFACDKKIASSPLSFETLAGPIYGEVLADNMVKVSMTALTNIQLNQQLHLQDNSLDYDFVNSGVPHAIIRVKKLLPLSEHQALAKTLRKKEYFQPNGANITFFETVSAKEVNSATFERGVEDFTQACGTGAIAAAYVHSQATNTNTNTNTNNNGNGDSKKIIQVNVPGGTLFADFNQALPQLIGPAEYLGEYEYT